MKKLLLVLISSIFLNAAICDQEIGKPANLEGFTKKTNSYIKEYKYKLCEIFVDQNNNVNRIEEVKLTFNYIKPFPSIYKADFVKSYSRVYRNGDLDSTDLLETINFQKKDYLKQGFNFYENDLYTVKQTQYCRGSKNRCGNKFTIELKKQIAKKPKKCQSYECIKHLVEQN